MIRKVFKCSRSHVLILASLLAMSSLVLTGCGSGGGGSDSYDKPETTETAPINGAATDVLVDASTVAAWITGGQVGAAVYGEKVVILDFASDPTTSPLRIKGACRVAGGDLNSKRVEGVATAYPLVATGPQIDAVIQRLGIDEDTTIVFTTSNAGFYSTRAYWMFRYWGFPVDKLKLLNGGNAAFALDYPTLMSEVVPVPTASEFSVRDLDGVNDDLRLSIGEMLGLVSGLDTDTDVILDARGATNYAGLASSPGYVTGKVDKTVYDGHPAGGQYLAWKDVFTDGKFKSATDLNTLFASKGWSKDKTTTVYCLSGYSATPLYFAVEAILGGKVRLYDGSWSQFGQYSDFAEKKGELPAGSPWAADYYLAADEGYRYNYDYLFAYGEVDANGDLLDPQPTNPFESTATTELTVETLKVDDEAIDAVPSPFNGDDAVPSQVEYADAVYVGDGDALVFPMQDASIPAGVVISSDQLKTLIDAETLVNAPLGQERVVILDATDNYGYIHGEHIPGAQLWDIAEHVETRVEGPAPAVNMVLSGAKMDAMLQKHGIDENTTIVITSAKTANYFPSRAYFLLRYYGFPKARIKVLNGYNAAWKTAGYDMNSTAPAAVTSTLTVETIANLQPQTRVALSELMDAARDNRGVAVDFRGDKSAAMSTPGVYPERNMLTDYVSFEGTLNIGKAFSFSGFTDSVTGLFETAGDIEVALSAAIGVANLDAFRVGDYSNPIYSYCRTGYIASTGFFVLDAILGVDVMAYDGSWSQWGKMSTADTVIGVDADGNDVLSGGELPAGSAWATDSATYMSVINYNNGVAKTYRPQIESLQPIQGLIDLGLAPSDYDANQVENEDADYASPSAGSSTTSAAQPFTPAGGGC